MEISYKLTSSVPIDSLTVGFFDGCHLGHQKLLSILTSYPGSSGVITFDPHPQAILSKSPKLITETPERLELLQKFPIDFLGVLPFSLEFASLSAEEFLSELHSQLHCKRLILGPDSRLGKGGLGNIKTLQPLGKSLGIEIVQAPSFYFNNEVISSQKIRKMLSHGDLETAHLYLGRPYAICGTVTAGNGIGSRLGFATLNVIKEECLLPYGVYACEVKHKHQTYFAVMNLGEAPTVHRDSLCLEAHLFNFSGNLYGERITFFPKKFLREERKFASKEELICAIKHDVLQAKALFHLTS